MALSSPENELFDRPHPPTDLPPPEPLGKWPRTCGTPHNSAASHYAASSGSGSAWTVTSASGTTSRIAASTASVNA